MKTILIILMIFWTSLKTYAEGYDPVVISNRLCFSVDEATELSKKARLYNNYKDLSEQLKEKTTVQSNIIRKQDEQIKKTKKRGWIILAVLSVVSFGTGFAVGK